jgi:hypothetical protein
MRGLSEARDELGEQRRRRGQQALIAGARGQGEQLPAQRVLERVGVALDEAGVGEHAQHA